MVTRRLLAVDPSLTCSGWALFELGTNLQNSSPKVCAVGKLRSLSPEYALSHRMKDLHERIEEIFSIFKLGSYDTVVCEAPTTMRDPHAAIKVEQVRAMFESIARSSRVSVPGRINPRTVHQLVLGLRGKRLKRVFIKAAAVQVVEHLYGKELLKLGLTGALGKHQDIVDALLVGNCAITWLNEAGQVGQSAEQLFESKRAEGRRKGWKGIISHVN